MITLATLHLATKQEIFDQVVAHLLKQNKRCVADMDGDNCAYRSVDGKLACAAGCLISDKEMKWVYEVDMNTSYDWTDFSIEAVDAGRMRRLPDKTNNLIKDLQRVHDEEDPEEWRHVLRLVANKHNLLMATDLKEA